MAFTNDSEFEDDFRKVGPDATASLEPAGTPSNPTQYASSENVEVAGADADEEENDLEDDDELEDEDDADEDDDLEDDDDDLDDEEDEDDELEDDEDDEDEDLDEDEEEEPAS